MKKITLLFLLIVFAMNAQGQQVKGKVTDALGEPLPGVNVVVKGTDKGTVTNFDGHFELSGLSFPATLQFSYLGYQKQEIKVSEAKTLKVVLKENQEFLDDVVVTASRSNESIKEAPVSIERYNLKAITRTTSPSFYDGLANLKGVDLNTSSLTFQSVNTRGFAAFANERFVQLVDGMDNSSPALNFPLGNLVGMSELDVQSVEILPGASSALYGANAFNGILNMRSKSPFKHKGLSVAVKAGATSQQASGTNLYKSAAVRYAFGNDMFAAKVNMSFLDGTDWLAVDNSDVDFDPFNADKRGTRESNPSYDGMNIYGDDFAVLLPLSAATGGAVEDIRVSRTGYEEKYLTDNKAKNMKGDFALHYRPSGKKDGLEFIWVSRAGTGKTTYQGANKYVMNNFVIHQHKLEIKNKNFFIRAYYTGEDAGDTYDTRFTAWNINRKWRSDKDWYNDYAQVYAAARLGMLPGQTAPMNEENAHIVARNFADKSTVDVNGNPKTPRYEPGTPEFEKAFNEVINDPNFKTGGKFVDNSNVKHVEGNYSFKDIIKVVDLQVGGSLRRYSLHSEGTIFTDYKGLGDINIDEAGAYLQITKKFLGDRLKISNSVRYDKQNNIDGSLSPRLSAVFSAGKNKEHNFRISYQTGFRNPSTQSLYIGLDLGAIALVGAAPDNLDRYHETIVATDPTTNTNFDADISGTDAYTNSYTLSSFQRFAVAAKAGDPNAASYLEKAEVELIKPERISTYEFGYRGKLMKKLGVDFSVYYNKYKDFSAGTRVMALSHEVGDVDDASAFNAIASGAYKPFQLYTNAKTDVNSYGLDVAFSYKVNNYRFGLVYDYAGIDFDKTVDPDFLSGFNTPEHRVKFSLGNDKVYKDLGFNINYRYQTAFMWEASFAIGEVPARSILDAQVNYNLKKYNMKFKLGGTNLLGTEYMSAPGAGLIGSMYYLGVTYGK